MADTEETFTQRILRRASQRRLRNSNTSLNSSKEALQRRYNILRAINDPSLRRGSRISINDSQLSDQSYIYSFNSTGISCNENNNDDNSTLDYKKFNKDERKSCYENFFNVDITKKSESLTSQVAQVTKNLGLQKKHILETSSFDIFHFDDESSELREMDELPNASMLVFIDDSEIAKEDQTARIVVDSLSTEAAVEMCQKIYTALEYSNDSHDQDNTEVTKVPDKVNPEYPDEESNFYEESNIYEEFDDVKTDGPNSEATGKSSGSNPNKELLPVEVHQATTIDSEGACALEPKSSSLEAWEEIESTMYVSAQYDEEQFLQMALGDELDRMSVTYDDSYARNRTHSDFTASDLISDKGSTLQKKVFQALNLPKETTGSKRPSTLNRSIKFYRSLSQRIKKKFRPMIKPKKSNPSIPRAASVAEEIDIIQGLLQEVRTQQTSMNESANALIMSDTKKSLMTTSELVGSERTLLLASLRRKAALDEIKNITSDESGKERGFRERAEVTVTGISVDLRDLGCQRSPDIEMVEWFMVAVIQGLKVWVTDAIRRPNDKLRIEFPGSVSIPDLTPGFKITVQVYSLRIKKSNCHDRKPPVAKQSRSTTCLPYSNIFTSPTKLFKKIETHVSPTHHQDPNNAWRRRDSSFVLSGFTELFIGDLSTFSSLSLMSVPQNSSLKGTINLDLACRLHLATSHQGFVNFYEEVGGFACWNRRWCVLKGHTLMFWNYPREQDIKEPLKMIELMACVSNEITTVDRKICPKPRTLLIETERTRQARDRNSIIIECTLNSTFVRHLLSFDTNQELNQWSEKLNHVLLALEEWQIIGQRTQPQVSDL